MAQTIKGVPTRHLGNFTVATLPTTSTSPT